MIKKNYLDVSEEEVTVADSKGATIRWLITDKDGAPRYTMRRFDVKPGGKIGLHVIPKSMKFMSCQEKPGFLTIKAMRLLPVQVTCCLFLHTRNMGTRI